MGAAARWLKSLVGIKKPKRSPEEQDNLKSSKCGKSKRWSVWKLGSDKRRKENRENEHLLRKLEAADQIQASTKHEAVINSKKQWAAIRIQSGFRRFLARRAFRALRALVRIQAIVRGRQVRRQAAMALRWMKALIKVQALVRARYVRMSREGRAVQERINQRRVLEAQLPSSEKGWCESVGTVEEIQTRLQQKFQAAIKRERAMQYALYNQNFKPRSSQQQRNHLDSSPWGWWENQALEQGFKHGFEAEVKSRKEVKLRLMPQITISYSGPICSSPQMHPSTLSHTSESHPNHCNKQCSAELGCKSERWNEGWAANAGRQLGPMKPGYMQATISVRAKSRSLSDPKLQLGFDEFHSERRCSTPLPYCLDTQNLLLQCN